MIILLFGLNQKVSFVIMDQMKTISLEPEEALTVFLLYVAREPKIYKVNELFQRENPLNWYHMSKISEWIKTSVKIR